MDGWYSEETTLTDVNMRPGGPSDAFGFSLKPSAEASNPLESAI
jgi:hypothetical protein